MEQRAWEHIAAKSVLTTTTTQLGSGLRMGPECNDTGMMETNWVMVSVQ